MSNKRSPIHQWADIVIMQFPVNWMGVPWSFKKYMDEVYTAGMDGRLTTLAMAAQREAPKDNYGMGGTPHWYRSTRCRSHSMHRK